MPKVSILSPAYNHEKYVGKAIQSVFNQTFQDFELIIADDASTDGTAAEIQKFKDPRMQFLKNPRNIGSTATTGKCWQYAQGEYICWLTTDDIFEPHMVETLANYLDAHPDCLGAFGLCSYIDEDGNQTEGGWTEVGVGQDRFTHLRQLFKLQHPYCPPASMIRRGIIEKLGYFPGYLKQTNDMAHWIRILFHGAMPVLPESVLRYRWRSNNANVSSRTLENDSRLDFELFEIIDVYRELIDSTDLLVKIFPEVQEHPWPLIDELIIFHLAHVAIKFNHPPHRMFGMHLLYGLMKNEKTAQLLMEKCNFLNPDLFYLQGVHPLIMNHSLYQQNVDLRAKIASLTQSVEALGKELETLQRTNRCIR